MALPAALGLAGWLGAGPLVATLLVGRTALFFPSLRWLATATGAWILLGALGALGVQNAPSLPKTPNPVDATRARDAQGVVESPDDEAVPLRGPERSEGPAPHSTVRGQAALTTQSAATLAPLASLLPLLAVLYRDDASFHLTTSSAQPPAGVLVAFTFVLAAASAALRQLIGRCRGAPLVEDPLTPEEAAEGQPGLGAAGAALWVGGLAVAAMTALNAGLFAPLASTAPGQMGERLLVLGNLAALCVAAFVATRAVRAPAFLAPILLAGWLAFAPLTESLPTAWIGFAMLSAGAGLLNLDRGPHTAQRMPGFALVAVALALVWIPAVPAANAAETAPSPLWSAPHEQNAAAGAFFSRLYAGPGALTAATSPPVAAAEALTGGTLVCFLVLAVWFVATERPLNGVRRTAAACLLLVAVLALWPITLPAAVALASLALIPLAGPSLWLQMPAGARGGTAVLAVSGYLLAGTAIGVFSRAATELLSRWPALASLPALGLVLLALALAQMICCSASAWRKTPASDA